MRRKGLWLSVLATALIAGSASADIVNGVGLNNGVYTYEGNGHNFFTYDTRGALTDLNQDVWTYSQVSNLGGTQSNNVHFQQYPGSVRTTLPDVTELMDNNYTRGADNNSPDWTNPDPYPGGDGNYAQTTQPWDSEQLFWSYVGDETSGTLHIGIVTGFRALGRDTYDSGDLFLAFGNTSPTLPNPGEYDPSLGDPNSPNGTAGLYQLAIGTGTGRNTGESEWILGNNWSDVDATPFNVESDPVRVAGVSTGEDGTGATAVDIARVEWTETPYENNTALNRHNFLAVAIDLNSSSGGSQEWLANLLANGFTAHWTYECGNDTVHHYASDVTTNTPVVPVPAAAPLGLLGMGLLALVRRVRRRPEC